MRDMSIEEFTRRGFDHTRALFDEYKNAKNLYDLLALIATDREKKIFDDPQIVRRKLEGDSHLISRARISPFL